MINKIKMSCEFSDPPDPIMPRFGVILFGQKGGCMYGRTDTMCEN